jgi:hypothetical protein
MGSRTKASSGCFIAAGIALSGCGASSDTGSGNPDMTVGAANGRGGQGGSATGGGNAAPIVATNPPASVEEIGSSSPSTPPLTSGLPGVEVPDFSGFSPGSSVMSGASGCQQAQREFVPQIPTVFILVDRSNSMFLSNPPGTTSNAWGPLRTGVLQVIEDLQAEVRFGFGAFSGQGATCPDMPSEDADTNNHADIAELYNSLEQSAFKDTPTLLALNAVAEQLWGDTTPGGKYILFVTDGEPDYCDDGNVLCPPDSVVGRLQKLALGLDDTGAQNPPIQTFVFGIDSVLSTISPEVLQAFANAGAGQPVAELTAIPNAFFDQCRGVAGWAADFATTGRQLVPGASVGVYSPVGGTATLYRPDPTDQAQLIEQIRSALAGVKSCTFDLAGDGIEVDLSRQDLGTAARVLMGGTPVPFDELNGWHMLSSTTVELAGAACESWRVPGVTSLDFDFPCDLIIIR